VLKKFKNSVLEREWELEGYEGGFKREGEHQGSERGRKE